MISHSWHDITITYIYIYTHKYHIIKKMDKLTLRYGSWLIFETDLNICRFVAGEFVTIEYTAQLECNLMHTHECTSMNAQVASFACVDFM